MFLKRLSPRTLFSRTSSLSPSPHSLFIAQWFTSTRSHPPISVWWDFENCNIPSGVNASTVGASIKAAVRSIGLEGLTSISAFGDISQIARAQRVPFLDSGINVFEITQDGKETADNLLRWHLWNWAKYNPPPAHVFLISGDRDFAPILHDLRIDNYNILLASQSKEEVHCVLSSAATVFWRWDCLVRGGKNLYATYFRQPLDTFLYGGPIEDPLSAIERPSYSYSCDMNKLPRNHLLSREIFWIDVQSFLRTETDMTFMLLRESRTRANLAYNLHKFGPSIVKSLSEKDVLHMVDMLITVKNLVVASFAGTTPSGESQYHFRLPS